MTNPSWIGPEKRDYRNVAQGPRCEVKSDIPVTGLIWR